MHSVPLNKITTGDYSLPAHSAAGDGERLAVICERITADEKQLLLNDWNQTRHRWSQDPCLHDFVEARANDSPEAIAILCGDRQVTYRELEQRSRQVACQLVSLGVTADEPVGLVADQTADSIIGLVGILRANAAYLPLDATFPVDRITFFLTDAKVRFVVGDIRPECLAAHAQIQTVIVGHADGLLNADAVELPKVTPESRAYVLFTSGSTGKPKGVMLNHRGPANTILDVNDRLNITSSDRVLALSALGFDLSVYDLFGMFAAGGTVVMPTRREVRDPECWLNLIREHGVTVWNTVPALMEMLVTFLNETVTLPKFKVVMLSGDWIPVTLPNRLRAVAPQAQQISMGGATEVSIWSTLYAIEQVDPSWKSIPYGRPMRNQRCYVLDPEQKLCPVGEVGELYLGGVGVALGYLDRESQTRQQFIADPFHHGGILYRTGDLCRYLPDGNLEFLGRQDFQVKIRGYRIDLAEIEHQILQHKSVREAIVIASKEDAGPRLIAYVVCREGKSITHDQLNSFLCSRLPDYMLPAALVTMDSLPLSDNGKVKRSGLPLPAAERHDVQLPQSATEQKIAGILSELLTISKLDVRDDFIALGGNSLLAVALVIRLKSAFGVELKYADILASSPNTRELATLVEETLAQQSHSPACTTCSGMELAEDRLTEAPLSYPQQQLWVVNFLEQSRARYNVPLVYEISGELDVDAMHRALDMLLERHDILRTVYAVTDVGLRQQVFPCAEFDLQIVDAQPQDGRRFDEAKWQAGAVEFAGKSFDLHREIPVRAAIYQVAPKCWRMVLVFHHIVVDGHSVDLIHAELEALYAYYNGHADNLPAPPTQQYANFAVWQQTQYPAEAFTADREYWEQKLSGELPVLKLPQDGSADSDVPGRIVSLRIEKADLEAARQFACARQTTLFVTLLSAIKTLLHRYTGQQDVIVGSAVATRDEAATESMIGYFINVLPMRTQFAADESFDNLVSQVRQTALGALAHKDYPFELLKKELLASQVAGKDPFRVMFVLENEPCPLEIVGTEVRPLPLHTQTAKFDLLIAASEAADYVRIDLEYRCQCFSEERMVQFGKDLQTILQTAIAAPQESVAAIGLRCAMPTSPAQPTERTTQPLCFTGKTTRALSDEALVHERFAKQAADTPTAVAVRFEDRQLTYRELETRANELAGMLTARGVQAGSPVAISLKRSPEMIIAVLAVLKAGGAYVPIDPALPTTRRSKILADSNPSVVISAANLVTDLRLEPNQADPKIGESNLLLIDRTEASPLGTFAPTTTVTADDLAYVLYTSGSTGEPKGVAMPHRALRNLIDWQLRNSTAGPGTKTLQFASLGFDVSFQEIFSTLCSGGELHLVREELQQDLHQLWKFVVATQIERVFVPFVVLRSFAEVSGPTIAEASLSECITAGEQLQITPAVREFFLQLPNCRLWNHYGPTETHVATAICLDEDPNNWPATPSVGTAIDNCVAVVLDEQMQPIPQGDIGELYLGGDCLAAGYLHRDDLTSARFVANPHTVLGTDRLYKTGDLCRVGRSGQIEFLGRNDHQVKIRGHRVELAEVEAAIHQFPGVSQAVVNLLPNEMGGVLVAHIVPRSSDLDVTALKAAIAKELPAYMVPGQFLLVQDLPKTASGKVDRRKLVLSLELGATRSTAATLTLSKHDDPLTSRLLAIWKSVLKNDQLTTSSNFFSAGGDSLAAAILFSKLEREFGKAVSITKLVQCPTVNELAEVYRAEQSDWEELVALQPEGTNTPLICLPGIDGHLLNFRALAKMFGPNQPVYGLQPYGLDGKQQPLGSIEDIARHHCNIIRRAWPSGPYHLAGFSFGGVVAYEIAQQLRQQGEAVTLAMIDSAAGVPKSAPPLQRTAFHFRYALTCKGWKRIKYLLERVKLARLAVWQKLGLMTFEERLGRIIEANDNYAKVAAANMRALASYEPSKAEGDATLYRAKLRANWPGKDIADPLEGWGCAFTNEQLRVVEVEGAHADLLSEAKVGHLVEHLRNSMQRLGQ